MRQQSVPAAGNVIRQGGNPQVGSTLSVTGAPGASALTVVGYANSITNTADGRVTPARSPGWKRQARQPARRCCTGSLRPAATPGSAPR